MLSVRKALLEGPANAEAEWTRPFQRLALVLAVVVSVGAATSLAVSMSAADPIGTMRTNAALAFIFLGFVAWTSVHTESSRVESRVLVATFVALLGVATLSEYVFSFDLGTDRWWGEPSAEARMSELCAVSFALLGTGYLLMDATRVPLRQLGRTFAFVVFFVGYVALMGHVFDVRPLYQPGSMTALPAIAAILFILAALAFFLARPRRGVVHVMAQNNARGILTRRLLPTVLLVAPFVAWLQARAATSPSTFHAILVALGNIALLIALVWWTAETIQSAALARERAEANERNTEERLQWALQAGGGGAWDWDLTADSAWWSAEMYALWQVPQGQRMTFAASIERIDPRDRDHVGACLHAAISGHRNFRCEFRIVDALGIEHWMESRGRASYDADGHAVRLLGLTTDVTAQKQVELSLRESNKALEQSNIELQRFAYVASHDLQTPLRTVASFAELLKIRHSTALVPEARGWLDRILSSVARLQSLVGDLLDYTQVGARAHAFADVSMDDLLRHAMRSLDAHMHDCGAVVEHKSLPVVRGDGSQLAAVMVNLLSNALQYRSAAPPHISVRADRVDSNWLFCVADNGIGIESRHYERIFEMFERLHASDHSANTGIGLAICRRVIQRHGGAIWVESIPGRGSSFYFTLPLRHEDKSGEHADAR